MRTGDIVKHRPTGETWTVAYCEGGYVCPCGWPCTLAEESDCELIESCTDAVSHDLLLKLAQMGNGSDPRSMYAQRVLAAERAGAFNH